MYWFYAIVVLWFALTISAISRTALCWTRSSTGFACWWIGIGSITISRPFARFPIRQAVISSLASFSNATTVRAAFSMSLAWLVHTFAIRASSFSSLSIIQSSSFASGGLYSIRTWILAFSWATRVILLISGIPGLPARNWFSSFRCWTRITARS